jgi:hypothetical protein
MFFLDDLSFPFICHFLKQHIKGMASMLEKNYFTRIGNGEILCSPIQKILDFKLTLEDHYSILLSKWGDFCSPIQKYLDFKPTLEDHYSILLSNGSNAL